MIQKNYLKIPGPGPQPDEINQNLEAEAAFLRSPHVCFIVMRKPRSAGLDYGSRETRTSNQRGEVLLQRAVGLCSEGLRRWRSREKVGYCVALGSSADPGSSRPQESERKGECQQRRRHGLGPQLICSVGRNQGQPCAGASQASRPLGGCVVCLL